LILHDARQLVLEPAQAESAAFKKPPTATSTATGAGVL
jgi:hypothetical protein